MTTATNTAPTLKVEIPVSLKRIADLLSCAFESGDVGYWCRLGKERGNTASNRKKLGEIASEHNSCVWLPLIEGGSVDVIEHNDSREEKDWEKPVRLDLASIKHGLALMAQHNGYQFGQFLAENEDMTTGDVFLQMCILGEEKYG